MFGKVGRLRKVEQCMVVSLIIVRLFVDRDRGIKKAVKEWGGKGPSQRGIETEVVNATVGEL